MPSTEWSQGESLDYHTNQWLTPKFSTIAFRSFIETEVIAGRSYLDLGCGAGGATFSLSTSFLSSHWTGVDSDHVLIQLGLENASAQSCPNLDLIHADAVRFTSTTKFDGVISLQTLSWVPDYDEWLRNIFVSLSPRWVALTSLFYEEDITVISQVHEHQTGRQFFYNTYSIPQIHKSALRHGYRLVKSEPFEVPIDLPKMSKPTHRMGTYTLKCQGNEGGGRDRRIQISGPILMNWFMLFFMKL